MTEVTKDTALVSDRELRQRIAEVIRYSQLGSIPYTWTRPAYEDMTSMGTPYTEPAQVKHDRRTMSDDELTIAILKTIDNAPLVPGKILDLLNKERTFCFNESRFTRMRCMYCKDCKRYISVMKKIMGEDEVTVGANDASNAKGIEESA